MIPNKSNFKFQELTPITGVKPYVIRFWETEFEDIAPLTSDQGQKLYARKDVEAIMRIKKLLFEDKMTIPEAKATLRNTEVAKEVVQVKQEKSRALDAVKASLDLIQIIKTNNNWN